MEVKEVRERERESERVVLLLRYVVVALWQVNFNFLFKLFNLFLNSCTTTIHGYFFVCFYKTKQKTSITTMATLRKKCVECTSLINKHIYMHSYIHTSVHSGSVGRHTF